MPACEFGIIAGGRGDGKGFLPDLKEDNDGMLSVSTTRLAAQADFLVVPVIHPLTMMHPIVKEATWRFLDKGFFLADDKRQPIVAEPMKVS